MKKIKFPTFRGFIIAEPIIIAATTLMLVAYPLATQPHSEKARQSTCTSNQKQVALATLLYCYENDETFPAVSENVGEVWELIDVYAKILECPSNRNNRSFSYAYNTNLSNLSLEKIPIPTEVALTADSDREDSKMIETTDIALRHRIGETTAAIVSFTDGHVAWMSEDSINDVLFK